MNPKKQRIIQWIAIASSAFLVFFILVAPRSRADKRFSQMSTEEAEVTLALNYMGNGGGPMKGIKILTRIAELHPKNVIAISQLAEFSMQTGQYEKAIARYQNLVDITSGNEKINAQIGLSNAYFMMGDTLKSVAELQKVFQMSQDSLLLQSVKEKINELQ